VRNAAAATSSTTVRVDGAPAAATAARACVAGMHILIPTAKSRTPDSTSNASPPTARESAAPATTAGAPATTASLATRRSNNPNRRYSRAPATDAGIIAGSGDATAIGAGRPSIARTGVAKADPPAPNMPKVMPTPKPASDTSTHVMPPIVRPNR
jgi:hypothetical protein